MNEKRKYPFPNRRTVGASPGSDATEDESFGVLKDWWRDLENDKGERAALRRAASLTEVMLSPAFHRLLNRLRQAGYAVPEGRFPKLAAIAGLAARLKDAEGGPLGGDMGTPKPGGTKARVAELRLRRLLACNDLEELYTLLRRVLALLDDRARLADLATTIWHWVPLDESRPGDPRRDLARDYYAVAPIQS